jgi:hypothetical protein
VIAGEHDYALQAEEESAFAPQDLLEALRIADVWEIYCSLPRTNQDEFALWIEKSPDQAARWRRIDALVLALRLSPLVTELQ